MVGMAPKGAMSRMGDVVKFPGKFQEPKTKGQKAKETKQERDLLAKQFKKDRMAVSNPMQSEAWPYREYPSTLSKEKELDASNSRRLKMLEGGEPLDFETFARQVEKGTAKQSVFDTFNPNIPERERELNKFRLFRDQARAIDKLEKFKELKKEFEKGGKYESIKNRKNIVERLNQSIRQEETYLKQGQSRGRTDLEWNPAENELQAFEGFSSFIPPEMLKKYLDSQTSKKPKK
jgi:hypothetical protein